MAPHPPPPLKQNPTNETQKPTPIPPPRHTFLLSITSNMISDIVCCIPQFRIPQGCRSFLITIISYMI